jgi:mono/diheme cytochrome c family protein
MWLGMIPIVLLLAAASYSRDIRPLLVRHCAGCHGDRNSVPRGGFSVMTYEDVMRGGSLTQTVIPGKPDRSLLIHFLEGRRGEAFRMPLDAPPLSREEIGLIRQWISQGAKQGKKPGK